MLKDLPAVAGASLALASAALFGLATPVLKLLGAGVGPWSAASAVYAGAALAGWLSRSDVSTEARVRPADAPRIAAMALLGAAIGPFALMWGLERTGALAASLALTLESVFTVALAWAWYREPLGRRAGAGVLATCLGALALAVDQSGGGATRITGLVAVAGATLAWSIDNNLSRPLAERDPGMLVMFKCATGAVLSCLMALASSEEWPVATTLAALALTGALGYGWSLRLYLRAQRSFGTARTASLFAAAPFIGALGAVALGERAFSPWIGIAAACLAAGVLLHATERHAHEHLHEPVEHEHAHRHDDGHHDHPHALPMPELHSHRHVHTALRHAHPHVPDAHHTHSH